MNYIRDSPVSTQGDIEFMPIKLLCVSSSPITQYADKPNGITAAISIHSKCSFPGFHVSPRIRFESKGEPHRWKNAGCTGSMSGRGQACIAGRGSRPVALLKMLAGNRQAAQTLRQAARTSRPSRRKCKSIHPRRCQRMKLHAPRTHSSIVMPTQIPTSP
jgi:hypothetical protein